MKTCLGSRRPSDHKFEVAGLGLLERSCTASSSSLTHRAWKLFALVATVSEGDVKLWSCMVVMAMWTTRHGINLIGNHWQHDLLRAARVANGAIPPRAPMSISKPRNLWRLLHALGLHISLHVERAPDHDGVVFHDSNRTLEDQYTGTGLG